MARGGESESYRNNENGAYKKNMAFNMFKPSDKGEDITPMKETENNEVMDSTLMKCVKKDIKRSGELEHGPQVTINAHALHLSRIVRDLGVHVRIAAWSKRRPKEINMLGWHQYQTELPKGFHEGSDEMMSALYKLNEVMFDARVVYPFMVYNYEKERYEYRKNSIMKFVRQSNIQLTCYSYRRNCDKSRLRCSLLNCDYTLQVLQQVATND